MKAIAPHTSIKITVLDEGQDHRSDTVKTEQLELAEAESWRQTFLYMIWKEVYVPMKKIKTTEESFAFLIKQHIHHSHARLAPFICGFKYGVSYL